MARSSGYYNKENITRKRTGDYKRQTNERASQKFSGRTSSFFQNYKTLQGETLQSFPYISSSVKNAMMVYTVPSTFAFRYSQMLSGTESIVNSMNEKIGEVSSEARSRLQNVYNILRKQEASIKKLLSSEENEEDKDFISLLQKFWDSIFEEQKVVLDTIEEMKRKTASNKRKDNVDVSQFNWSNMGLTSNTIKKKIKDLGFKGKLSNMSAANIKSQVVDEIIKGASDNFGNELAKLIGDTTVANAQFWFDKKGPKRNDFSKTIQELADKTEESIEQAIISEIQKHLSRKNLRDMALNYYKSYSKSFQNLVNQVVDLINTADVADSASMVEKVKSLAFEKQGLANKLGILLEPVMTAGAAKIESSFFSDPVLIPLADQAEITTDIVLKLKEDAKVGVSLKSTLDNKFSKVENITTGEILRNDEIFKEEGAFRTLMDENKQEAQALRFLTMSAASMFTLGVAVPDTVYNIIVELRNSFRKLGTIKAILGSLLSVTTDKNIDKNKRLAEITSQITSFPIVVALFRNVYWTSEVLKAGIDQLVDNYNYRNARHFNESSMENLFQIPGLVEQAKKLDDLNFRYVFLSQRNMTDRSFKNETSRLHRNVNKLAGGVTLADLYEGSVAAKGIMEAINELFIGKMFDIYTSHLHIYIDMEKYIKAQGGR